MFYKYPRTYHFAWSDGVNDDDKIIPSLKQFEGKRVVVTLKMDGENTSLYSNHIHARSLDSAHHVSRDWIKQFWSTIKNDIPRDWRICGENLFAKHSIHYSDLESYFYGFSIWNENNVRLSWNDTLEWFSILNIYPVEVLYNDVFDESRIRKLTHLIKTCDEEGFVMTIADELPYFDFSSYVVKYVRSNHVQTSKHWKTEQLVKNKLRL